MADVEAVIKQFQITLDSVTWTPIRATISSNGFTLHDYALTTAILTRTLDTDITTQSKIPAGVQAKILNQKTTSRAADNYNFQKDDIMIYAQSDTGTITAVVGLLP